MWTRRRGALRAPALAALALLAPLAVSAPAGAADPTIDRPLLRGLLRAEVAAGMPGVFAEVRDGEDTARLAAGVADVDTDRPMRPHLRHRAGSITKTFVAVTVLQLAAEGRIGLDAPVGQYLPDLLPLRQPDGTPDRGARITVRMLLQHTSGVADYTAMLLRDPASVEWAQHTSVPASLLAAVGVGGTPTMAPGAGWSYSNTNYVLAGLIVEKVTGRPYGDAVRERIIAPLGLRHTSLPGTDARIRGPHARAYQTWADGRRRDFTAFNMTWAWAAGELISSTADLNRFFRALLTGTLLPPDQQRELLRTVPTPYPGARYGLGLIALTVPCPGGPRDFYGHNGSTIGHWADSLHSADGRRQLTSGENQNAWATDAEAARVSEAKGRFQYAALCGAPPPEGVSLPVWRDTTPAAAAAGGSRPAR